MLYIYIGTNHFTFITTYCYTLLVQYIVIVSDKEVTELSLQGSDNHLYCKTVNLYTNNTELQTHMGHTNIFVLKVIKKLTNER